MQDEVAASFDGVLFRMRFEHGRQVVCEPICVNCGHPLDKQSMAGANPMLACRPITNIGSTSSRFIAHFALLQLWRLVLQIGCGMYK